MRQPPETIDDEADRGRRPESWANAERPDPDPGRRARRMPRLKVIQIAQMLESAGLLVPFAGRGIIPSLSSGLAVDMPVGPSACGRRPNGPCSRFGTRFPSSRTANWGHRTTISKSSASDIDPDEPDPLFRKPDVRADRRLLPAPAFAR